MCVIVDANCVGEMFGTSPSRAGKQLLNWIDRRGSRPRAGRLVFGADLAAEIDHIGFGRWLQEALQAGNAISFEKGAKKELIDKKRKKLKQDDSCKSNDEHIIALAQVSGARLLYSADRDLHQDFRNQKLLSKPRGNVFPRGDSKSDQDNRGKLLNKKNLCGKV